MQTAITVKNLKKQYPKGFCLDNVSFTLPKGCIMGLIGENGAGKTTTIKLLLNQIRRDGGEIEILGGDILKNEQKIKEQIGVVLDEGFFYEALTPKQVGAILRRIFKSWDDALFLRYLREFSLESDKTIKEFSKGMRMKFSIVTALCHHPKLLILDEATSGLDPIVRSEILDIFLDFIQDEEHSILFSSHITTDLEKIADYITFLHEGKVVFSESKDELLYRYGLVKCSEKTFAGLDKSDFVAWRASEFGIQALTADKKRTQRRYGDLVVDDCTLDDIMLYYVKGEKSRERTHL